MLLKLAVLRATLIHFHCIVDNNLIYIANIFPHWLHTLGFQIQIVAFDKLADCAADILHRLLLRRTLTPPPNPQKPG